MQAPPPVSLAPLKWLQYVPRLCVERDLCMSSMGRTSHRVSRSPDLRLAEVGFREGQGGPVEGETDGCAGLKAPSFTQAVLTCVLKCHRNLGTQ